MRKTVALVACVALTLAVAGVAWAATVQCQEGALCAGTDGPDKLVGTAGPNTMDGMQDDDRLVGYGGADAMSGDTYFPTVDTGTPDGDDELFAGAGQDDLYGMGGSDLLRGGGSADDIFAIETLQNPGEDTVLGGGGKDYIGADDGLKDTIDCGDDVDTVVFDEGIDVIAENCEVRNP